MTTRMNLYIDLGYYNLIKLLISDGADINKDDADGRTPLEHATKTNNVDAIKFLISNGADVNKANSYGRTPLDYAIKKNNVDMIKFLISNGAKVFDIDDLFTSGLLTDIDLVKTLYEAGIDFNKDTHDGNLEWLLEYIKELYCIESLKIIYDQNFYIPLISAMICENKYNKSVKYLISRGVKMDIPIATESGWSIELYPVDVAILMKNKEILDFLQRKSGIRTNIFRRSQPNLPYDIHKKIDDYIGLYGFGKHKGRKIHTGKRGGRYYKSRGRKVYL
jgi:hypothetical protein